MLMFNEIISGLQKFFTKDKIFIFIAFFILAFALFSYSDAKLMRFDNMETGMGVDTISQSQPSVKSTSAQNIVAPPPPSTMGNGYSLAPVANPSDLLPIDKNSQWAALNPVAMNQGSVLMPDLLTSGYHIGLDTIGQTLKNANYQLRSDPIIQKSQIGPWNQSTIEPGFNVPFELGEGSR